MRLNTQNIDNIFNITILKQITDYGKYDIEKPGMSECIGGI